MNQLDSLLTTQSLWLKTLGIVIGTFILEDFATVLSAVAAQAGQVTVTAALSALYTGVVGGDLGLYALGLAGAQWPQLRRFLTLPRQEQTRQWFGQYVIRIVAITRFVPGARLPFYTACGFFRTPFLPFALTAIVATLIWTTLLFLLSLRIGRWLLAHQGGWRWAGITGFAVCIFITGRLIARFQRVSQ